MHIANLIPVFSLLSAVCSAFPHVVPRTTANTTLYAYGTNISGLAIVYGNTDGLAYISSLDTLPSNFSTLYWSTSGTTFAGSLSNSSSVGNFYIDTEGFAAAGFTSSSDNTTTISTSEFTLFGSQVVYIDDGSYQSQFWAESTDEDGIWAVYWNADGTTESEGVPIVVKSLAPSTTT